MQQRHVFVRSFGVTALLLAAAWGSIASSQTTRQEPPARFVRGPWSDARIVTRIKFRQVEPNPLGDIEILATREVLAVQERTITARMSGSVNGKERAPQQGPMPRFLSPGEFKKMSTPWGQKEGRKTLTIAGKSVACDVYRKTEKHPTRDIVGVQKTYISEDVPSWVVKVVKEYQGEGKTSESVPYIIMDFTWGPK